VKRATARRRHALRVAAVATLVVMVCYVAAAIVLNLVVTNHLVGATDARLNDRLQDASRQTLNLPSNAPTPTPEPAESGPDVDEAPIFLWSVGKTGVVTPLTPGAPVLPATGWGPDPVSMTVGDSTFRMESRQVHGTTLVAGQSLAGTASVQRTLLVAELVFGALLALAVFVGATVVGLRASAPSELVRRRQAEFTADASHELRTPISVIEAEVGLALDRPRDAAAYREVLSRVGRESGRLRRIVEDLLWLARAEDEPDHAEPDVVSDVAEVTKACVQRFAALAATHSVSVDMERRGPGPFTVHAAPEMLDRLAGVLIDNACKFAGDGGRVVVSVRGSGHRVELRVDDSGPGIPPEQRDAVFDRFHRATHSVEGTGLGLAIADTVVRSTQGEWSIGVADIGGARMEVAWRAAPADRAPATTPAAGPAAGESLTKSLS
jgi:signal transduction histidine kinase